MDSNTWLIFGNNGLYAILYGIAYWLLQTSLNKKLEKGIENTKHELQLEYEKQKIVYEHQKESFKKILIAMGNVINKVLKSKKNGRFKSFEEVEGEKLLDELIFVIYSESLFVKKSCLEYLNFFIEQAKFTCIFQNKEDEHKEINYSLKVMKSLFGEIRKHFHFWVGISTYKEDPLPEFVEWKKGLEKIE